MYHYPEGDRQVFLSLGELIRRGNIKDLREHFNRAFWDKNVERPDWRHLEQALRREDRPAMKLLIAWGASATPLDIARLKREDEEKFQSRLMLLRQCGLKPPLPDAVALAQLEESADPPGIVGLGNGLVSFPGMKGGAKAVPQEWKDVLDAFHRLGSTEAIIAGGALRDLFHERPIKDVDIFLQSTGGERPNRQLLEKVFRSLGWKIKRQSTYFGEEEFPGPIVTREARGQYGWGDTLSESWTVKAGTRGTEFNVVFVGKGFMRQMDRTLPFGHGAISLFDVGLCQIYTDGDMIFASRAFREDSANCTLTLKRPNDSSSEHLRRIARKYPDFTPCPEAHKMLNPPKPPKSSGSGWFY